MYYFLGYLRNRISEIYISKCVILLNFQEIAYAFYNHLNNIFFRGHVSIM